MKAKVTLYIREHSSRKYKQATAKWYDVGTVFVLRYKSRWETLGSISYGDAIRASLERSLQLMNGWKPPVTVQKQAETGVLMLDEAKDTYLKEIENGRKPKTFAAYSVALRYFYESTKNKAMADISRADLLIFAAFLRDEKEQAPRSAYNKFEAVMTFLKHFDINGKSLKITSRDWPKFVEEEPEIYEQEMLDKFFSGCDADELVLFEFFLMTGMREQEVIYATDRCVDFSNCTVSVKHNPAYGWMPKMYKERTIPVPKALIDKLKKMLVSRGKGGLLFPTKTGQPKLDFLDMSKGVARRAGVDQSEVYLHKFRATFATRCLWAGVDLRTVQLWMGHTDLASTMRYLKPNRAVVQEKVESIWN